MSAKTQYSTEIYSTKIILCTWLMLECACTCPECCNSCVCYVMQWLNGWRKSLYFWNGVPKDVGPIKAHWTRDVVGDVKMLSLWEGTGFVDVTKTVVLTDLTLKNFWVLKFKQLCKRAILDPQLMSCCLCAIFILNIPFFVCVFL